MNDFDYDVMQKKRIARGAFSLKRGSKTKFVSLPSDHMTKKQWEEKNGEVKTLKMEPITWKEFKNLTPSLQNEYFMFLIHSFGLSMTDIGNLFGVHSATVKKYLESVNIPMTYFQRGKRMPTEVKERYENWVSGVSNPQSNTEKSVCVEKPAQSEEKNPISSIMALPHCEMQFEGIVNIQQIANTLNAIAGNKYVCIKVICDVIRKEENFEQKA